MATGSARSNPTIRPGPSAARPTTGSGDDHDRRRRPDAPARAHRRPRPLHVRPDRGLDRGDPPTLGRRDRPRRRRSRGHGAPGRRDHRARRGLAPEPRGRAPRRDRGRPRAGSAHRDGRHGGRHHRRPRLPVRARGRRSGGVRDRDPPGRPRRRRRRQGDRVRSGDAHDDRTRRQPHGQRWAGAHARRAAGGRRDRVGARREGHEPRPGRRVGPPFSGGRCGQRRARLARRPAGPRGARRVGRLPRADDGRRRRQPDPRRHDACPARAPGA